MEKNNENLTGKNMVDKLERAAKKTSHDLLAGCRPAFSILWLTIRLYEELINFEQNLFLNSSYLYQYVVP